MIPVKKSNMKLPRELFLSLAIAVVATGVMTIIGLIVNQYSQPFLDWLDR
jgi:hypothetical protein